MPGGVTQLPYSDINRGFIYLAAIPFTDPRPLNFFIPCNECTQNQYCTSKTGDCGKAERKSGGFEPQINSQTGRYEARVVPVIVPHKARLVVVFQADKYNHASDYHQVFVAPIQTLHRDVKTRELAEHLTGPNDLPQLHYIGLTTGQEAFINLADLKRIHKSLLLAKRSVKSIDLPIMRDATIKLAKLVDVKEIEECQNCQRKCENCTLKQMEEAKQQVASGESRQ